MSSIASLKRFSCRAASGLVRSSPQLGVSPFASVIPHFAFLPPLRERNRISKIAKLSKEEIKEEVDELSKTEAEHTDNFQGLAMAMMELDEPKIGKILTKCFSQNGVEDTILNVLVPFLEKASLLWLTGSISSMHEQFASCVIRRRLLTETTKLKTKKEKETPKVLLYLPEGDQQELYLIFVQYLLKKRNINVVYLGTKVVIEDLQLAASIHKPNFIYTIISERHKCYVSESYIGRLSEGMEAPHLLVSGFQHTPKQSESPDNVTVLEDLNELVEFFSQ